MQLNRYTKAAAITNIRDYYSPPHSGAPESKYTDAFERAKEQYIEALESQIQVARQIGFVDVFPKHLATTA